MAEPRASTDNVAFMGLRGAPAAREPSNNMLEMDMMAPLMDFIA